MADRKLVIPTLTTQRLSLAPLSMDHSRGMYQMWRHKEVQKYSGPAKDVNGDRIELPAKNAEESNKLIHFWRAAAKNGWGFRWAILIKGGESSFIGHLGFNQMGECAEIAYHMNPEYWGNGFMQEAATTAIQWVHSRGSKQIDAYVEPDNLASVRLTEALGLRPTGTYVDGAQRYQKPL